MNVSPYEYEVYHPLFYEKYKQKACAPMCTVSAQLTFYIPLSASLKDKRQVCRSLIDKTRTRFNASVSEVDTQDVHQTLTLGVAVVSGDLAYARRSIEEIIRYMETAADAELTDITMP